MTIKEILKELGMEEQDFKKLYKSNKRYSKYSKEIDAFNKKYFDDNSTYRLYSPKVIYNRLNTTGETPQFITNEVTQSLDFESQIYENYDISASMYEMIMKVDFRYFEHGVIPQFDGQEFIETFFSELTSPSELDIRHLIKVAEELEKAILQYIELTPDERMKTKSVPKAFDNFTQFYMQFM